MRRLRTAAQAAHRGSAGTGDDPAAAGGIVVAYRRAEQIAAGDVIILPELVYLPEPEFGAGRPRWIWRERRSARLSNAHAWRWVYDVNELTDDPDGIGGSVSYGFVLVRVSDDQPNQGGQFSDLILCLRGLDLVAVQVEPATAGQARDARRHDLPETGAR